MTARALDAGRRVQGAELREAQLQVALHASARFGCRYSRVSWALATDLLECSEDPSQTGPVLRVLGQWVVVIAP